jgi:hypothetical protein
MPQRHRCGSAALLSCDRSRLFRWHDNPPHRVTNDGCLPTFLDSIKPDTDGWLDLVP